MIEVLGDSARGSEFALVRLSIQGDRIVEADAPGLERSIVGLTLLEAATVGGETLAVDALANALGPVFKAAPSPARVAVAMSGGVDSAVALLRYLPDAIGVTLRLWLDHSGYRTRELTSWSQLANIDALLMLDPDPLSNDEQARLLAYAPRGEAPQRR